MRLGACRQLLATILVSHPRRDELTPLAGVNFKLLDPSTSKATNNWKVFLPEKRVKWIVDRHLARIAGIILGRVRESQSLGFATSSTLLPGSGWSFTFKFARPLTTRIKRESSIAT